jgi:DNA replication protein DnaC
VSAWNCEPQEDTFAFCREQFTEVGAIVALVGERGVGKTFIAAQLCRERIDLWLRYHELDAPERPAAIPLRMGRYMKLTDLIARFKPLYADFGSIETDRLMNEREKLCMESLLCLDELHECDDQRLKGRVLTDILDRRYANRLDTLVISNETEAAFRQTVGDSALSRITEHGDIVTCRWESFRRAKRR